ncbi:MAG TPA: amidohydrolase family protein, partial [Solirubrobacteraceae bacterium]|nr:amidohydrolase family protein [Solirubrobacteraceae bacterium]
ARLAHCPLYVVHVSCQEAIDPVARARAEGWRIWAETCTQYLFIDEHHLEEPDFGGAKYVFTPPPRPPENHEHLWRALGSGVLSAVSSDHCPFNWGTQKTLGRDDFSQIPNGGPGVENRLHMLHHFGVREGRLTMNQLVELCATNPARLFGLFPRKGTIAVGSDADIVVWDPEKPVTISASTHHSNVDYNLYEGTEVIGSPEVVLVRGQVVIEGDSLVGAPGMGRFVRRAPFGSELGGGAA